MAFNVSARQPRWLLIPVRVLLVSFLLTLLSFAISLLVGIIGMTLAAGLRDVRPNMTGAYRHVAIPVAIVAASVTLVSTMIMEIRQYRRDKALLTIEQASAHS